jgi:hypothetical protein
MANSPASHPATERKGSTSLILLMLQCRKAMNLLGHSSTQDTACQALNFNWLAGILARFW